MKNLKNPLKIYEDQINNFDCFLQELDYKKPKKFTPKIIHNKKLSYLEMKNYLIKLVKELNKKTNLKNDVA